MRGKILLVDDNKDLRTDFRLWYEEYDITEAACAQAALDILKRPNELDLIILDVQLPGMDGLAALEKIKALAPDKSVIIMTGFSTKDTAIHALIAKADNYIEKPFDIKVMREAIEKELTKKAGPPDEMDIAGKIEHVRWFLEGNCFKKITLRDAAQTVYLSPKYLSRLFRERTGMGFNEYRLKVKMAQAKKLLRSSAVSVKQLSAKLGYANAESFIRQFEKIAKTTPSRYRGNCKKRR
ncbi:MAG: response regulator [Elusimicrobia bacterium]|nr:response regulator [Elusimicrobiota bacterium]